MSIYTCNACRFTFERREEPKNCPDCGKERVREASESETQEYIANHESTDQI